VLSPILATISAEANRALPVSLPGGASTLLVGFVSDRYFRTLETRSVAGRVLDERDAVAGPPVVALLGARTWHDAFDSAPDVVGRTITVAGWPVVIVGVTPPGMAGLALHDFASPDDAPQIWLPLETAPSIAGIRSQDMRLSVAARLREGIAWPAARTRAAADSHVIADSLAPDARSSPRTLRIFRAGFDWHDTPVDALRAVVVFLFVPMGVLAIGCVNVVNLQLARATDRVHELRVRIALGASRWRLIRLLASEVVLLAAVSGLAGWRGAAALLTLAQTNFDQPLRIDLRVLWFGVGLLFLIVAAAGVAPAWIATRETGTAGLRDTGNNGIRFRRIRAVLVATQMAASLALVFISALGVQAVRTHTPPIPDGADRVVVADFDLATSHYTPPQVDGFIRGVLERLRADNVSAAGFSDFSTQDGVVTYAATNETDGRRFAGGGFVTAGWFAAMNMTWFSGRTFEASRSEPAVVINRALAAKLVPSGGSIIGRELFVAHAGSPTRASRVVGVVSDSLVDSDRRGIPMIFLPMPETPPTSLFLSVRMPNRAMAIAQTRSAISAVDPSIPWTKIDTFAARLGATLHGYREMARLGLALGLLSLGLASAGLFALMSYGVRRRTREIGVRLAIGASPRAIVRLVLRQGFQLVTSGIAVGLVVALPIGFVMRSAFIGISPVDPFVIITVVVIFLGVALIATMLPAWYASRVDPTVALRHD
jgi:predicted permease